MIVSFVVTRILRSLLGPERGELIYLNVQITKSYPQMVLEFSNFTEENLGDKE